MEPLLRCVCFGGWNGLRFSRARFGTGHEPVTELRRARISWLLLVCG
jgi:hypothetical protein